MTGRHHPFGRVRLLGCAALAALAFAGSGPAAAQEVGENRAWQFETPQDLAARTAILEVISRRQAGAYAAPVYNTNIARQYNCSVGATATGNSGAQSALANSPSLSGPTSNATGNSGNAALNGGSGSAGIGLGQHNNGQVSSTAIGSTTAHVSGSANQALNSTQSNSGNQQASVTGSTACGFGTGN